MTNVSREQRAPVQCTHEAEYIGNNQDMHFVVCRPCGKVFLRQGGLLLSVPLAAQNDATDESHRPALAVGE